MGCRRTQSMDRREFLAAAAAVTVGGTLSGVAAHAGDVPAHGVSIPDAVHGRSDFVVRGRRVHQSVLAEMLEQVIRGVTGAGTFSDGWRHILRADDVVGLKFNSSGAEGLGVSEDFGDAVITSLLAAGFEPRQIVAIEAPGEVSARHGLVSEQPGWQRVETEFGSGRDQLSDVLDRVTAIVNIPFLKDHNITGVTCACKNLSHGLVKHPARFHGNHCSPYIADIIALPQIRSKVRLHLVNALRVVFDGGPEPHDEGTWDAGVILAGRDPVAIDALGLEIINSQRAILGLAKVDSPVRKSVYLEAAAERGLGVADTRRLGIAKIRV